MKYFTADLHLGDTRLFLFPRPFDDTVEMEKAIIKNWNSIVTDDDVVYVIGDVAVEKSKLKLIKKLKGVKHLILGNYDTFEASEFLDAGFESVSDSIDITVGKGKKSLDVHLVHYPTKSVVDRFNLVGHIHGAWRVQKNMLNVGLDAWNYKPMSEDDVLFMYTAIKDHYDDDVWVQNIPANKKHNSRGKPGGAAKGTLKEGSLKSLIQ